MELVDDCSSPPPPATDTIAASVSAPELLPCPGEHDAKLTFVLISDDILGGARVPDTSGAWPSTLPAPGVVGVPKPGESAAAAESSGWTGGGCTIAGWIGGGCTIVRARALTGGCSDMSSGVSIRNRRSNTGE